MVYITIEDIIPPTITCPDDIELTTMINTCWMQAWYPAPIVSDNCGNAGITVTYSAPPGSIFPIGDSTVWMYVTDASGNVDSCSFVVTVIDPQPPVFNVCPIPMVVNNAPGLCEQEVSWIQPTVFDNCDFNLTNTAVLPDGTILTNIGNLNNSFPVGTSTVTYIATDLSGGTAICEFTVTVIDVEAPVFEIAPQDTVLYAVATDCSAPYAWADPVVTDNCEVLSVTWEADPANTNSGDYPVGVTTVTYTATDIYGNVSTHVFTITVIDTIAPVIADCPADIVVSNDAGVCGAEVSWTAPTATDNCGIASIETTHSPDDFFGVGSHTVTYTVTDIHGNTSICAFTVTVNDSEAPVFVEVPAQQFICAVDTTDYSIEDEIMAQLLVTDNCEVESVVFVEFDWIVGDNTVVITATDIYGNTSDTTVIITVHPMPVVVVVSDTISACNDETITLAVDDPNADYDYTWFTAWGAALGDGPTYQFAPVRPHHEGTYIVEATNEFGCTSSATVVITVENFCDIVIPEFFSPGDGNGINDFFVIENLEAFPGTELLIFNRWGSQVYSSDDYLNNWDGRSDSRFNVAGDELPEGTYFYILKLGGVVTDATYGKVYQGYVYLKHD
jgi:gliding motility-associated-like protein